MKTRDGVLGKELEREAEIQRDVSKGCWRQTGMITRTFSTGGKSDEGMGTQIMVLG